MSSGQQPPFPPPPPPGPPPGPPSPYDAPPPGPPHAAWPSAPPAGYPEPPRERGRPVGLVALPAVAVLVVIGLGIGAFVVLADDDGPSAKGGDPTEATTDATEEPSEPATSETATVPSPTPEALLSPDRKSSPDDQLGGGDTQTNRISTGDHPGDWDFTWEDVELFATLVDSHDHETCAGVESGRAITQGGCEYAVQWNYTAIRQKIRLANMFLVYDSAKAAKAARRALASDDFDLPPGSLHAHPIRAEWLTKVEKNIVVVTIATANAEMNRERFNDYLAYMNTDFAVALTFE